jgi:hypothetical protein
MDSSTTKSGAATSREKKKGYEDVKQGIKQLYPPEESKIVPNVE